MANPRLLELLIQRLRGNVPDVPGTLKDAPVPPHVRGGPTVTDPTLPTEQQLRQKAMPRSFQPEFDLEEGSMMPPVPREASPEKLARKAAILDEIIKRLENAGADGPQPEDFFTIGQKLP